MSDTQLENVLGAITGYRGPTLEEMAELQAEYLRWAADAQAWGPLDAVTAGMMRVSAGLLDALAGLSREAVA